MFYKQSMKALSVGLITQTDRVGLGYYFYENIDQLLKTKNKQTSDCEAKGV